MAYAKNNYFKISTQLLKITRRRDIKLVVIIGFGKTFLLRMLFYAVN